MRVEDKGKRVEEEKKGATRDEGEFGGGVKEGRGGENKGIKRRLKRNVRR